MSEPICIAAPQYGPEYNAQANLAQHLYIVIAMIQKCSEKFRPRVMADLQDILGEVRETGPSSLAPLLSTLYIEATSGGFDGTPLSELRESSKAILEQLKVAVVGIIEQERARQSGAVTEGLVEPIPSVGKLQLEDIWKQYPNLTSGEKDRVRKALEYWRDHGGEDECIGTDEDPDTGRRRWAYPAAKVDEVVKKVIGKRAG